MKTLKNLFVLMLMVVLVVGCNKGPSSEYHGKPKETISLERAHEMYQAYQERFNALTEFRNGNEDSRYGWHSIEFYKDYIAYLEHEAKKVKIEVSGIRMYYVAYPKDAAAGQQQDYQTYIFVPTYYDKKTNSHIAFDPLHVDKEGNPLPIHEIITKGVQRKNGVSMVLVSAPPPPVETESSIANMAQMCRPNCPAE
jgi:hypothetical protein